MNILQKIWLALWRWLNPYTQQAEEIERRVSAVENSVSEITARFGDE